VNKPDRKIFETALQRLGVTAALTECLFITENAAHIQAARNTLHMKALQFRSPGSSHFDFESIGDSKTVFSVADPGILGKRVMEAPESGREIPSLGVQARFSGGTRI